MTNSSWRRTYQKVYSWAWKNRRYLKYAFYLIVLALAIWLPLKLNQTKPGKAQISLLNKAMIWAIATLSLNLILGYTGQVSLAHGAFFGIGAYSFAVLGERVGLNIWLAIPLGCLITALVGLAIGLPSLRTKGPYFAIVTLCFNVIIFYVFYNWQWLSGGLQGQKITIPSYLEQRWVRYYVVLGFLLLTLFIVRQITKSLLGSSLIAIRSNENLAEAVGISSFRNKLLSFTVSCFLVGLAGALFAVERGSIDVTITNQLNSFYILIYLLIGGVATLGGPLIGAIGIYYLLEKVLFDLGEYRYLIFGFILLVVIIYFPMGVVGGLKRGWEWIKGKIGVFESPEEAA